MKTVEILSIPVPVVFYYHSELLETHKPVLVREEKTAT